MAEPTADLQQFEDFLVEIIGARVNKRLNDAVAQEICAELNDPLPDPPPVNDGGDTVKVGLIIRLAHARAHKTLTNERMQEIGARLTRVSERPVRTTLSPEVIVGEANPADFDGIDTPPASEPEKLVDVNDVVNDEDEDLTKVERETDTDPPPSADS